MLFASKIANGQQESLAQYSKNIKLGMTTSTVDSLMPYFISNMHKAGGGPWRYLYGNVFQSQVEYQDKDWNSYTFRMLFRMDKLIYFDLFYYKSNKVLFSQIDSFSINQLVQKFDTQYQTTENINSLIKSFHTKVYDLDNSLELFFTNATPKDKKKLIRYSKSLCPEYSASAIIRILELEKIKSFLNPAERLIIKQIINSEIQINFIIGCVYNLKTLSEFLKQFRPELNNVIE